MAIYMSNCKCQNTAGSAEAHVPDFSVVGFRGEAGAKGVPALEGVLALDLSVCVTASYNAGTNQICFNVPVYGNYCVQSPIPIPINASLKACVETCGSIIPHGLQATLYLNGNPILTQTLWGTCP